MKRSSPTLILALFGLSGAMAEPSTTPTTQTPPVRIETPDITVPPRFGLPAIAPEGLITGPVSADEAVRIALARQPSLAVAAGNARAAAGRTQQARADLQPQFSLSATATNSRNFRGAGGTGNGGNAAGGTGLRMQGSATVEQLLFDFGRTRALVRQQEALERAARLGIDRSQLDVASEVRRAFYTLRQAQRVLAVAEGNVSSRQTQLAVAEARVEAGVGAPADVVQAKTVLADAVIALTNARASELGARVNLAFQMGIDPRTPFEVTPSDEPVPPGDANAWIDTAQQRRPELREATERVSAAEFGLTGARRTNAPRLGVVATLAGRGDGQDPISSQSGSLGLALTWPLGDGGLTAGRIREAQGTLEAVRAQRQQVVQQVTREVLDASVVVTSAEQRLSTARAQAENARRFVQIAEGRYRGGIAPFLEVVSAQDLLFAAERNLAQAEADLQRARVDLRRAIGTP